MSDRKIEVIESMYQAFGRGEVDAVLSDLADDVDWVSVSEAPNPLVPWYGRYSGKSEVPEFFKAIGSHVDVTEFSPLSFSANDTDVMVALRWAFTVRATGRSAALHMQHWFRFADNGKQVAFVRTCEDSEQTAGAFG